ncbi:unnamed protein product [Thlaspi arvense]|uniref:Uncharacterized protein n=1 Tax=Thlaspi arvense TaxID=13288 RepID=A0AAU9T4H3_THLAR|nr:unnamed protein product [Thlaspi arvense]
MAAAAASLRTRASSAAADSFCDSSIHRFHLLSTSAASRLVLWLPLSLSLLNFFRFPFSIIRGSLRFIGQQIPSIPNQFKRALRAVKPVLVWMKTKSQLLVVIYTEDSIPIRFDPSDVNIYHRRDLFQAIEIWVQILSLVHESFRPVVILLREFPLCNIQRSSTIFLITFHGVYFSPGNNREAKRERNYDFGSDDLDNESSGKKRNQRGRIMIRPTSNR